MAKDDLRKIGNRWSYTFGNKTTLHLYSKPDIKTKRKIVSKKSTNKKMVQGPRKGQMKSSPKAETIATGIPGVKYTGSGKDPAVNELLKKLKKDGADSLDSSGMGTRWKV